jgi:hypothetical protein
MLIELRYNLNHRNGEKPWKVFIDQQLLKVDVVEFNCPISSSIGVSVDGKPTGHVVCNSNKVILQNGVLTIES